MEQEHYNFDDKSEQLACIGSFIDADTGEKHEVEIHMVGAVKAVRLRYMIDGSQWYVRVVGRTTQQYATLALKAQVDWITGFWEGTTKKRAVDITANIA